MLPVGVVDEGIGVVAAVVPTPGVALLVASVEGEMVVVMLFLPDGVLDPLDVEAVGVTPPGTVLFGEAVGVTDAFGVVDPVETVLFGDVVGVTEPFGVVDPVETVLFGDVVGVTEPLGVVDPVETVLFGEAVGVTDPFGVVDPVETVLFGDVVGVTEPLGVVDPVETVLFGDVVGVTDPLGVVDPVETVLFGDVVGVTDPLGVVDPFRVVDPPGIVLLGAAVGVTWAVDPLVVVPDEDEAAVVIGDMVVTAAFVMGASVVVVWLQSLHGFLRPNIGEGIPKKQWCCKIKLIDIIKSGNTRQIS